MTKSVDFINRKVISIEKKKNTYCSKINISLVDYIDSELKNYNISSLSVVETKSQNQYYRLHTSEELL